MHRRSARLRRRRRRRRLRGRGLKRRRLQRRRLRRRSLRRRSVRRRGIRPPLAWRVLGTWETHRVFRREPAWGRTSTWGSPFHIGAMRGGVAQLIGALCRFCPWLLSRRRGVHSGEDSGMRGEARIGTGDAASSCVRLRSLSSRRLLDASRFDCVRLPTCSRSPDSSRSSSMSST